MKSSTNRVHSKLLGELFLRGFAYHTFGRENEIWISVKGGSGARQ